MSPAQLAHVAGADPKWIQNARRLLARPAVCDAREARWLGLVYALHTGLDCSLREAARVADLALATRIDHRWLRVPADPTGRVELVLDLWRDRSIFLARIAQVLATSPLVRRGRPPIRRPARKTAVLRAIEYGVDVSRLRAGLARTVSERLVRLDDNAAFLAAGRASLARRSGRE